METHKTTDDTAQSRSILEGQLRECYGRVVYTHKTHEAAADILEMRLKRTKLLQIALSAATTAGFIAAVFGGTPYVAIVGVITSTTLLLLNLYSKEYDLGQLSQKHRQTGADVWLIREKYLSLITDLRMGERPIESLQQGRDELLNELHAIYAGAPSTNSKAYKRAQKALQYSEDMTFSDAEIDAFLPKELKKASIELDESTKIPNEI